MKITYKKNLAIESGAIMSLLYIFNFNPIELNIRRDGGRSVNYNKLLKTWRLAVFVAKSLLIINQCILSPRRSVCMILYAKFGSFHYEKYAKILEKRFWVHQKKIWIRFQLNFTFKHKNLFKYNGKSACSHK